MTDTDDKQRRPPLWTGRPARVGAAIKGCSRCSDVQDLLNTLSGKPAELSGTDCNCGGGQPAPPPFNSSGD